MDWAVRNWWYSIPMGVAVVYMLCFARESIVYQRLGIKAKDAPAKGDFPKSVTLLEGLAVFFFLLWFNCGAVFWRRGWRPLLLLACVLCLLLLPVALSRAFRRLIRPVRQGGRGYPAAAARSFCVRRTLGSSLFAAGWWVFDRRRWSRASA